jgi:type III secretory pathway component EscU
MDWLVSPTNYVMVIGAIVLPFMYMFDYKMSPLLALRWASPGAVYLVVSFFNNSLWHASLIGIIVQALILWWWISAGFRAKRWRLGADPPFSFRLVKH